MTLLFHYCEGVRGRNVATDRIFADCPSFAKNRPLFAKNEHLIGRGADDDPAFDRSSHLRAITCTQPSSVRPSPLPSC